MKPDDFGDDFGNKFQFYFWFYQNSDQTEPNCYNLYYQRFPQINTNTNQTRKNNSKHDDKGICIQKQL